MSRKKKAVESEVPPAAASSAVAASHVAHIELGRLVRAPENVRHAGDEGDIFELVADIRGHGLLQSLIGYVDLTDALGTGKGPFVYIVGGGRRLKALQILRDDDGAIGNDYLVPVQLRPRDEAIELSLAENLARRDMNPVDQFRGFRMLIDAGAGKVTAADIARRLGYTDDFVRQRLRLAGLHEEVLKALEDGAITLDAAYAYATTQDLGVQAKVFRAQQKVTWKPHDPDTIKREVRGETFHARSPIVRFVGLEAYEAAGGTYEDDLFASMGAATHGSDPAEKRLVDVGLIQQLARAKADELLPALIAKHKLAGCTFVTAQSQYGEVVAPKAPKGFAKLTRTWNHQNGEWTKYRKAAIKAGIPVHGIAYVSPAGEDAGELALYDKVYFVPKDKVAEVVPPATSSSGYREPTPEEREAAERERFVDIWAGRLAVPKFAGGPLEGRVQWPSDPWGTSVQEVEDETLGAGYRVTAHIFVPAADRDAHVEEANAQFDAAKAAKAAEAAEKEAAAAALADAAAAMRSALLANPPAVVTIDESPFHFFRHEDGSYPDARPFSDEEPEFGFETLEELLDHAIAFGSEVQAWPTIEAYFAANAADAPGENAPEVEPA